MERQYAFDPIGSRSAAPRIEGVGDRSGGTGNRQTRRQGPRRLAESASARGAMPTPFGIRAIATIDQTVAKRSSPNVIGVLRGTNPSQAVIYTAHYDHLGVRDPQPGDAPDADRIYNGAIDNASGLAGTLEIAQALAHAPAEANPVDLCAVYDSRRIGSPGRRILRRTSGASG